MRADTECRLSVSPSPGLVEKSSSSSSNSFDARRSRVSIGNPDGPFLRFAPECSSFRSNVLARISLEMWTDAAELRDIRSDANDWRNGPLENR